MYLSGVLIEVNQLLWLRSVGIWSFGVAHAEQVVPHVVTRILAAGVPLNHLAQIELDLLTVGAQVPTLGQLGLRLETRVVGNQAIEDRPRRVVLVGGGVVPVESRDVSGHAEAQCAA